MKVIHVVASLSPQWGGPVPAVQGLTESLVRKGVEVTIFAPVKQGFQDTIVRPEGTEVRVFEQGALSRIWTGYSPELARTLSREVSHFDLVHIHEIWHYPHFAAYQAAKKANKPYIVTIHGALEPWCLDFKQLKKRIYAALIQRRILNEAAAIHAIYREEAKHIQAFGVNTPVAVIPNGIDPEEFQDLPPRRELEIMYPQLRGKKVLLFLGRIHPKKGLDILASAFGKIAVGREDVHLVIAGPDSEDYQMQVEKALTSEGITSKTTFTGMLTGREKLAALSRADVFVLPSYSEGFSIAILEAMICGIPVIITHQCHFPEVAEAGVGIVIKPDAEELAEALAQLLDDPQLRKEMAANGQQVVSEKFTWGKIAEQMIELYKNVRKENE